MSSAKRELGCPQQKRQCQPSWRFLSIFLTLLIPPFGLAAVWRREGCCQGSRCGRLAQPLTTPFPERSSSQFEWRVLPLRLAMSYRLAGFEEIASSPRFHSHSQRSPWFGLGARWCPGRSGAAIYPTVSGGACFATTTSHDFAVTGDGCNENLSRPCCLIPQGQRVCPPFWASETTTSRLRQRLPRPPVLPGTAVDRLPH